MATETSPTLEDSIETILKYLAEGSMAMPMLAEAIEAAEEAGSPKTPIHTETQK